LRNAADRSEVAQIDFLGSASHAGWSSRGASSIAWTGTTVTVAVAMMSSSHTSFTSREEHHHRLHGLTHTVAHAGLNLEADEHPTRVVA
jgi:hypothetical protein